MTVSLETSDDAEHYELNISALKDGKRIGMLITHGAGGYGWDYRFRVE